jgi:branched-chain amino acid transport system substrate-binding protein
MNLGSRKAMSLGLIAILMLIAAACLPGQAPGPKTPYKVGISLALSGPLAVVGVPSRDGALALAKDVNERGGINGHELKLVVYDDAGDATKAVLNVKKLVQEDQVLAIFGPGSSDGVFAAIPIVEKAKITMLGFAAADKVVNPVRKWVFKLIPGERLSIGEIYSYIKKKGWTKIALIHTQAGYALGAKDYIQRTAAKQGFELVAVESYAPRDKDMKPQLTRIKAANPQVIITYAVDPGVAIIAKNIRELGIKTPFLGPHGMVAPALVKFAGEAYDGLTLPVPRIYVADQLPKDDPQKPAIDRFREAMTKYTGKAPDPMSMNGWDPMLVIAEALKRSDPDPAKLKEARAKVRDAIEGIKNFPAVIAPLTFSPTDHEGIPTGFMVVAKLEGGKFTLLK